MKITSISERKLIIIVQVIELVVFFTLFILLPRPTITLSDVFGLLPYICNLGLGLVFVFAVYSYLNLLKSFREAQKSLSEAEIFREQIGYLSDVGKVRELDEDSILVIKAFSTYGEKPTQRILLTVADGMGGHSKGEVASYLGVTTVAEKIMPYLIEKDNKKNLQTILSKSMKEVNQRILKHSMDHPECEGMGTTMTTAILDGKQAFIAHIGDTRAYVVTRDGIEQLTKDHSYVQELVDKGEITPEEARTHPKRNVITQVVGYYSELKTDTYSRVLEEDASLLLCCDGLTSYLTDEEIRKIVSTSLTPKEACKKLVELANERGGTDNISVALTPMWLDMNMQP